MLLPDKIGKQALPTDRSLHHGRHVENESIQKGMDEIMNLGIQNNWTKEQYTNEIHKIIRKEHDLLASGQKHLYHNKDK